jgi:glycine cleavage system H protein
LIEGNSRLLEHPKLLNDSPYDEGWFARLQISRPEEAAILKPIELVKDEASRKIAELHIRCFKAYPDHEMYELGSECAKVLAHLNDLLPHIAKGEVVHIVSDDTTAYVEMVRWTEQTGNRLADWREEGKISHFLIEKGA